MHCTGMDENTIAVGLEIGNFPFAIGNRKGNDDKGSLNMEAYFSSHPHNCKNQCYKGGKMTSNSHQTMFIEYARGKKPLRFPIKKIVLYNSLASTVNTENV